MPQLLLLCDNRTVLPGVVPLLPSAQAVSPIIFLPQKESASPVLRLLPVTYQAVLQRKTSSPPTQLLGRASWINPAILLLFPRQAALLPLLAQEIQEPQVKEHLPTQVITLLQILLLILILGLLLSLAKHLQEPTHLKISLFLLPLNFLLEPSSFLSLQSPWSLFSCLFVLSSLSSASGPSSIRFSSFIS